jgi:hypothetical protein
MLVIGVAAQEVDCRQLQLLIAVVAGFLVVSSGGLLHAHNLSLHRIDVLHDVFHSV